MRPLHAAHPVIGKHASGLVRPHLLSRLPDTQDSLDTQNGPLSNETLDFDEPTAAHHVIGEHAGGFVRPHLLSRLLYRFF